MLVLVVLMFGLPHASAGALQPVNDASNSHCETDSGISAGASACISWLEEVETNKCKLSVTRTGSVSGGLPVTYDYSIPGESGTYEGGDSKLNREEETITIDIGDSETVSATAKTSPQAIPGADLEDSIVFSAKATAKVEFHCNAPGLAAALPPTSVG